MSAFLVLVSALVTSAQQTTPAQVAVDLKEIGYPQEACKYEGKTQIEFLDSTRLLLSFPFHSSPCDGQPQFSQKWRAAVVDASGKTLRTLDLEPGEIVRAGPAGHILSLTEKELRILDSDFTVVQTLSWPKEADPAQIPHGAWAATISIELAPSRQGFVIRGTYPKYGVAYFEGNPAKQTSELDSCSPDFVVTDGGFACREASSSLRLVVHPMNDEWRLEDSLFQKSEWVALPARNRVLLLTNKFQLYRLPRPGNAEKAADLHWLAPGLGYPRTSYALTSGDTHRILVSSWGARLPLSDSSGVGYWNRVVVLDYSSGQILFQKQYHVKPDFAISPDGHLLAVREKNHLSVIELP
jgi:hypothetical protein